ncbi:MAG: hypothetical protein OEY49_17365 [Candidatus Heimdallarchaeota archaeon]|nr:hypothetical protein [Candidatus Heimdallarchaeota archaeon]
MAKKSKSIPLDDKGMGILPSLMFAGLFIALGGAIVMAGIRGLPATAPIVITIGMMLILIGLAPFYIPIVHGKLVPKVDKNEATA